MATSARNVDCSRAAWRKSTHSSGNGECVEIASVAGTVAVRDSKHPDGPKLLFLPRNWTLFVRGIKTDRSGR